MMIGFKINKGVDINPTITEASLSIPLAMSHQSPIPTPKSMQVPMPVSRLVSTTNVKTCLIRLGNPRLPKIMKNAKHQTNVFHDRKRVLNWS